MSVVVVKSRHGRQLFHTRFTCIAISEPPFKKSCIYHWYLTMLRHSQHDLSVKWERFSLVASYLDSHIFQCMHSKKKSKRSGGLCDVMMTFGYYFARGLESSPIYSCTSFTAWMLCIYWQLKNGNSMQWMPNEELCSPIPEQMWDKSSSHDYTVDCQPMPAVGQDFRALLSASTVCCYRCSIVGAYTLFMLYIKEVHGRIGGDYKPCPK